MHSVHDGNRDHMAVVAAAMQQGMQQGKAGKDDARKASTRATIRKILIGIK